MSGEVKNYEVHLPVFKQGNDLASNLKHYEDNPIKGFQGLADQYIAAAKVCNAISEALAMAPSIADVSVQADTHYIAISASESIMTSLLKEGYVTLDPREDDDEDDSDEDDYPWEDDEEGETLN